MEIKELKEKILNNTADSFMVWKLTDDSSQFIAQEYYKLIAKKRGLVLKFIDSLKEITDAGFIVDDNLYIYKVDKLEEFTQHDNCIIICNKTKYKDAITIPKLEAWQFSDHLKFKLPGLGQEYIDWLLIQYNQTYGRETAINFYRLENDMDKIAIFPEALQESIFTELYNGGEYSTISNLTIFDLSTAILKKDIKTSIEVLKVFDYIDSKPDVWLLSILLNNFKNILDIQTNPKATPESLGISDKQFYVIKKYNCGYYNSNELVKIYKMLTNCEYMYKFGGLTTNQLTDYIICKILGE